MEGHWKTPGRVRLEVENAAGRIGITTHDGAVTEVSVQPMTADAESLVERSRIAHREVAGGHVVTVSVPKRSVLGWLIRPEVEIEVRVPPGASLEIAAESADVQATGSFNDVEVRTASGSVHLDEATGSARLRTASGALEVGALQDDSRLDSVSGDVAIDYSAGRVQVRTVSAEVAIGHAASAATVRSVSGDVRIRQALSDVRVDSVSGDVTVDSVSEGRLWAKTVSGDVTVGIARGSVFHIDALSVSGQTRSEIPLAGQSAGSDGAADGGAERPPVDVEIRTMSGDVHVLRAQADYAPL
jgi:hypothetical protein